MNNKLITYLIPIFIGVIILLGIMYFVSLFWNGDDRKEASLADFKGKTEIFSSKKEAYDTFISDSIVNVRQENVSVDLNSLFSSRKKQEGELIPEDGKNGESIGEEQPHKHQREQPAVKTNSKMKVEKQVYTSVTNTPPKTFAPPSEAPKEKVQQRRESFNSFSQSSTPAVSGNRPAVVQAVVHSKQTVYNGSTVKLRIVSSFSMDGVTIPDNTIIYGITSMLDERVLIHVNSINLKGSMVPVTLRAYDRDGMEGVYIPGLTEHDLKNESVDQAISEAQSALNVPRVASGVLNVARNRNRQASAIITNNYQLILK